MNSHRIRVTTLGDLLLQSLDTHPNRDVLIFPEARHTYTSFVDAAYRRARSLLGVGVERGDYVGVLMANCMEYMELVMGCALLGAVAVPMNARYKASELAYVVNDADLKLLVTSDLIADYADFGMLLHKAFPDLAEAQEPTALNLQGAPQLQGIVMLGSQLPVC